MARRDVGNQSIQGPPILKFDVSEKKRELDLLCNQAKDEDRWLVSPASVL